MSGSFVAWRISDGVSSLVGKSQQPVLVDARCELASRSSNRAGILPSAQAFDRDVRAMGPPSAESGGSAQTCKRLAEIAPGSGGAAGPDRATEAAQEASALSLQCAHRQRSSRASGVL